MRGYHGHDAGEIFDVFGHSRFAHELMRAKLLVFDAAACAGVSSVREIASAGPCATRRAQRGSTAAGALVVAGTDLDRDARGVRRSLPCMLSARGQSLRPREAWGPGPRA